MYINKPIKTYLDDLAAKINNFEVTIKKQNVAEGAWTGYSKMHDRYLYRQSSYSAPREESKDVEERVRQDKKTVSGGEPDLSGKLPLDI